MDIFDPENGVTFKGIEGGQDGLINDAEVHSPRGEVLFTISGADLRGRVLDPTFVAYNETSYRGQIPSLEGHA